MPSGFWSSAFTTSGPKVTASWGTSTLGSIVMPMAGERLGVRVRHAGPRAVVLTNCTTFFMAGNCLAHAATSDASRCSVGGNQETVQGKNFIAYSYEVVAVMDTIPFSTAMGMAARMTGSGTGPEGHQGVLHEARHLRRALLGIGGGVDADDLHRLALDPARRVDLLCGALGAPLEELADAGDRAGEAVQERNCPFLGDRLASGEPEPRGQEQHHE